MNKKLLTVLAAVIIVAAAVTAGLMLMPKPADKADQSVTNKISSVASSEPYTVQTDSDTDSGTDTDTVDSDSASSQTSSADIFSVTSSKNSSSSQSSKNSSSDADSKSSSSAASSKSTGSSQQNSVPTTNSSVPAGTNTYYQEPTQPASNDSNYDPTPFVMPEVVVEEQYDESGRLIADTDLLDGVKAVAITFDDGPSRYTSELLDGLRARGVRATFFLVGSCVDTYPELLPIMVQDGHQLGNHTYNHPSIPSLGESGWRNELERTDNAVFNACGQYTTAFRPPYGSYTEYQARSIDKTFTIWSVDTLDWQSRNKESIKRIMFSNVKDGSIILLHDLYKTSVDAALEAIDQLQAQGYVFVTIDELLTRYGYPISNTAHFSQKPVDSVVFIEHTDTGTDSDDDTDLNTETDTDTETTTDTGSDTETETDIDIPTDTDVSTETDDYQETESESAAMDIFDSE